MIVQLEGRAQCQFQSSDQGPICSQLQLSMIYVDMYTCALNFSDRISLSGVNAIKPTILAVPCGIDKLEQYLL